MKTSLTKILKENVLILVVFVFSTIFFIYQHTTGISWDFASYVLNAKYIFNKGTYFEWFRPPLTPFIIGIFSLFGWKIAEYLYIIFASGLFFFSSIKFSEKNKIQKELFYIISLSFFTLNNGLNVGTELLSLSLLQLFLAYIDVSKSGLFVGLSILVRYNNIIYAPLLLFQKDTKKILISFAILAMVFLPWFFFNFYKTGDPFTSLVDLYMMNIRFRGEYRQSPNLKHIIEVTNVFTPLMILGLIYKIKKNDKNSRIIFLFLLLTLMSYFMTPFKNSRYLFNIILPTAYFSCIIFKKNIRGAILLLIFGINVILSVYFFQPLESIDMFKNAVKELDRCETKSNAWIVLEYLGFESSSSPWDHQVSEIINNGTRLLFFYSINDPDYVHNETFINQFNIINKTGSYLLLGLPSVCNKQKSSSKTYTELVKEACDIDLNKYQMLFGKNICNHINFQKCPNLKKNFNC